MMIRAAFQGSIVRNEPAYRPRPVTMPGYHKFTVGAYDAFVARGALEAIADKTRQAAPNEMIGYLVGRPFRDAKGTYAVVTEAIFAESARCGPVTVETTLDDERGLLASLLADHPLAERLGWFHSHPFFMPTYSPTDLENQRFWSEPYQLGLLACLDRAGAVSVFAFRGPEAEAVHLPYAAAGSPGHCVSTFRPMPGNENRETTPRTARATRPKKHRRSRLALVMLAIGVIWPMIYLIGVGMIVQAMHEGRDSATPTAAVTTDSASPLDELSKEVPVEPISPVLSKEPTPAKSAEQPAQKRQ